MRKPKAPKLKKYPKKPKSTAKLSVWENYEKRADVIKKENDAKTKAHKAELKKYEAYHAKIQKIKNKF